MNVDVSVYYKGYHGEWEKLRVGTARGTAWRVEGASSASVAHVDLPGVPCAACRRSVMCGGGGGTCLCGAARQSSL